MEMWTKSSYSYGNGGNCVEVYRTERDTHVRDTQHRQLGQLRVPRAEWAAFLNAVRTQEL
ncbi:DUF397 domain-containing protein [Lipingzhangella sp. LS1_29]|uniref:DUF397 domain-containing protein n=1 Tax=Lipingzhangella rawalii TaxID=2055835 RepID=A0ABU2HBM7_9ACTN|nr:DUF397 domain-containing protein [Lipingzhangella rawalii]MDS1272691.1 DUF397 domain-containing protein [Lipingzhangella rawalii]